MPASRHLAPVVVVDDVDFDQPKIRVIGRNVGGNGFTSKGGSQERGEGDGKERAPVTNYGVSVHVLDPATTVAPWLLGLEKYHDKFIAPGEYH
ncbi:hypothetical protein G6O69_31315 [Pseudenhygromyxa sp. WMMC2535]|uniref:hypothetical protein n=1 Tax=Pseudenhygromyxa sp. WMMC2535 TaxID=2712867 RepID=UPI00159525D5|nr:hypothetical protein [Pseudenhygromyxa sp. WMMC2535]NVB42354.1 hypothetical protein [Pseudenhygromyxa sp. WMMC2535]